MAVRVTVDAELCMGSGYCIRDLPELFRQAPDETSFVPDDAAPLPPELEAAARDAAARCPADAIEVIDD